jgi:hypothetical protein
MSRSLLQTWLPIGFIVLQASKYNEDDAIDSKQTDPLAAQLLVALVRAKTGGTGRRCAKTQASFAAALAAVARYDSTTDKSTAAAGSSNSVSGTVKQQLVVAAVYTRLQQCLSERYLTVDDMRQAFPATAVSTVKKHLIVFTLAKTASWLMSNDTVYKHYIVHC